MESLASRDLGEGGRVYYDSGFRNVIEYHLDYIMTGDDAEQVPVEPGMRQANNGDLYGLLRDMKIANQYHWIIMRIMGLVSPMDYTVDMEMVPKPSEKQINTLRDKYMTVHTI